MAPLPRSPIGATLQSHRRRMDGVYFPCRLAVAGRRQLRATVRDQVRHRYLGAYRRNVHDSARPVPQMRKHGHGRVHRTPEHDIHRDFEILDCHGLALRLIATHLGLWPSERRLQIRQLLRVVRDADLAPIILLGDLNEWFVWGRPVRWLHKQFKHTPSPASFPAGRPMLALDRIWVRPRQALRHLEVHMSTLARVASDHLPVSATLDFDAARMSHA